MSDADRSLLPPTASDLVRALDRIEARLFDLPVNAITKDPQTVDAAMLDHLAWEYSVDVWDMDWAEEVKRSTIAASAEIHRYKGTPYAIQQALGAFDLDAEMVEWWQPDGITAGLEAGSFQVTAYAGGSLYADGEDSFDSALIASMRAVVVRAAPVSRKLIFRLGERFSSDAYLRTGVRAAHAYRDDVDPGPRPASVESGPVLRSGIRARRLSSETHDVQPRPATAPVGVYVRQAVQGVAVSQEIHDVERRAAG